MSQQKWTPEQVEHVIEYLNDRDGYDHDLPFDEAVIKLVEGLMGIITADIRRVADLKAAQKSEEPLDRA